MERLTPQKKIGPRSVDCRLIRHTEQILNLNNQVNARFAEIYFHFRFLYLGLILSLLGLIFLGLFIYKLHCGEYSLFFQCFK